MRIAREAAQALGVKISADHFDLVRVSLDGEILATDSQPFDPRADGALDAIAGSLAALVPKGGTAKLLGIGLGVAVVVYVVVRVRRHLLARSRQAATGQNAEQAPR